MLLKSIGLRRPTAQAIFFVPPTVGLRSLVAPRLHTWNRFSIWHFHRGLGKEMSQEFARLWITLPGSSQQDEFGLLRI